MAVISHKYKFIYALAPRTASTATANYLIKKFNAEWIPSENLLDNNIIKVDKKHCTFTDLIDFNIVEKHIIRKYLTFVTVRNPFESLYSAWYKKKFTYVKLLDDKNSFIYKKPGFLKDMLYIKDHEFSDWIVSNYKHLAEDNTKRHINGAYLNYAERILKFERLNEDLRQVIEDNNIPYPGDIPIINKTEGKPSNYREFYTSEAREIIEKTYFLDLKEFSYCF